MRALVAGVVLLVGALLVPVATAGWWVRDTLVPTQAYVDTVAPLATDPAVVSAVEERLVEQTLRAADQIDQLNGVPRPQLRRLVGVAVQRVVQDPVFAAAWRVSNRVAHEQLVAVLTGDSSAVRIGQGSTVDLRLATPAAAVRQELIDAGVPFAASLPQVQASFPIGHVGDLTRARQAYTLLDRWGRLLPLAALAVIGVGLLVARRRGRALAWTAVASLLGLGALAVGLLVGRAYYLGALPSGISRPAASAVFDTVTVGLRHDLLLVAAAALVALVVGAVASRLSSR